MAQSASGVQTSQWSCDSKMLTRGWLETDRKSYWQGYCPHPSPAPVPSWTSLSTLTLYCNALIMYYCSTLVCDNSNNWAVWLSTLHTDFLIFKCICLAFIVKSASSNRAKLSVTNHFQRILEWCLIIVAYRHVTSPGYTAHICGQVINPPGYPPSLIINQRISSRWVASI